MNGLCDADWLCMQESAEDDCGTNIGSLFDEAAAEGAGGVELSDYGAADEADMTGNARHVVLTGPEEDADVT